MSYKGGHGQVRRRASSISQDNSRVALPPGARQLQSEFPAGQQGAQSIYFQMSPANLMGVYESGSAAYLAPSTPEISCTPSTQIIVTRTGYISRLCVNLERAPKGGDTVVEVHIDGKITEPPLVATLCPGMKKYSLDSTHVYVLPGDALSFYVKVNGTEPTGSVSVAVDHAFLVKQ